MELAKELIQTVRKYNLAICHSFVYVKLLMLKLFLISDYHLNTICNEICFDETLKCIMSCDSTDSECLSTCVRAEAVCLERK